MSIEYTAASTLLRRADMPTTQEDLDLLSADLIAIQDEEDIPFQRVERVFLMRLGGIKNLESYMKCLRVGVKK